MKYKHLRVAKVTGFVLPEGQTDLILWSDEATGDYLRVASEIDNLVLNYDRRTVIANLALQALIGEAEISPGQLPDILKTEVTELQNQRQIEFGKGPFLLYEVTGEADIDATRPVRDTGEFSVGVESADIKKIKKQSIDGWRKSVAAFLLVVNGDVSSKLLIDGIYFVDADGKAHFVISFTGGNANLVVSRQFDDDFVSTFQGIRDSLFVDNALQNICRLLVHATMERNDKLRGFLFAWTGLEVFVNKTFKLYEDLFIKQITGDSLPEPAKDFLNRTREVMKDKYRLKDKFIAIGSILSDDATSDIAVFASIKKIRDEIIHGGEVNEDILPVQETVDLLRKYLKLHLMQL